MRAPKIVVPMLMAVAVALPLVAGEGHTCAHSTQDCLDYMAANLAERGWVGIEADDESMRITRVVEGSPAEAAGLAVGDVVTAANGVAYAEANKAELDKIKKGMTPGSTVTFTVERAGAVRDVEVTLAALPDEVRAQWVGAHMLQHAKVASR
jgi:S1-C subfamily serine protease